MTPPFSQFIAPGTGESAADLSGGVANSWARHARLAVHPDQNLLLARILDQLSFGRADGSLRESPLQEALRSGRVATISQAIDQLSASQGQTLRERLGETRLQQLLSLSREPNYEFFQQSLLHWAQGEEDADHLNEAMLVYQLFHGQDAGTSNYLVPGLSAEARARAAERINAIEGRGSSGLRAEFLFRRLAFQAADPVMAFGMAVGGTVFQGARAGILSRLLGSASRSWLTEGLMARGIASTGAFFLEVPAFWATTKGINSLLHPGSQHWDAESNWRELASLGISLGALKLCGTLAQEAFHGIHGTSALGAARLSGFSAYSAQLFPQVGMLGGLWMGNLLEQRAGLRPQVDGATSIVDSLATLVSFHVGGRLSQEAFPGLHHFGNELTLRSTAMAERSALGRPTVRQRWQEFLSTFRDPPNGFGGLREARAGAYGEIPSKPYDTSDALEEAREQNSYMVGPGGEPPFSKTPSRGLYTISSLEENAAADFRLRQSFQGKLNRRTGGKRDAFEPKLEPNILLHRLSPGPNEEIRQHLGVISPEAEEIDPVQFGHALAMALQERMDQIFDEKSGIAEKKISADLSDGIQGALKSADEMVGIVEYLQRSHQDDIMESFGYSLGEHVVRYPDLQEILIRYLGPHFNNPVGEIAKGGEVIKPDLAVLSIGSGDMMALHALLRHRIAPGELSWRMRLFAIARQQTVADEINRYGTYAEKLKNVEINHAEDHKIEAVGPQGLGSLSQDILKRTVQVQMLNVPSNQLHEILTADYIKNLPQNAILFEVIGGFIGPKNRGVYQPGANEPRTLLPYQLIQMALRAHGRTDVRVVSGGGFIPGRDLWEGERVEMVFAGPESEKKNRTSPAAEFLAQVFAGEGRDNGYVRVLPSHNQHSTELGKAMKNVTSLMLGLKAGRQARLMLDGQPAVARLEDGEQLSPPRWWPFALRQLQGRERLLEGLRKLVFTDNPTAYYNSSFREPVFNLLEGLLLFNDTTIKRSRVFFESDVRNDFWRCTDIKMEEVLRVMDAARKVDIQNRAELTQFLTSEVLQNPNNIASTRNPKRGIAQAIVEMWREMGSPYRDHEVMPTITQEGVNSLEPMMDLYNYPNHPIERRRFRDERLYELYDSFFPDVPKSLPVKVGETIDIILKGGVEEAHPNYARLEQLRKAALDEIDVTQLRKALGGSSQEAVDLLENRLRLFLTVKTSEREPRKKDMSLQREIVTRLITAMAEGGNPVRVDTSPLIREPYRSLFVIRMKNDGKQIDSHRAYIRVGGPGIMDRLTQLGFFLRHFPLGEKVHVEVEVAADWKTRSESLIKMDEIERTAQEILSSHLQFNRAEVTLQVNGRRIDPSLNLRPPIDRDAYYAGLAPLIQRLQASSPDQEISAQTIRKERNFLNNSFETFLRQNPGWPMLLGYVGGPLNGAVKASFTRQEKQTVVGVYDGNRMVSAFTVFRGSDNRPWVLNHHFLKTMVQNFSTLERYQDVDSTHFFRGLPLDQFLSDYEQFAMRLGNVHPRYRVLPIRSLPVEEAVSGRFEEISPTILTVFLRTEIPLRDQYLAEIEPLYEKPFTEIVAPTIEITQRYLKRFETEFPGVIESVGLPRARLDATLRASQTKRKTLIKPERP